MMVKMLCIDDFNRPAQIPRGKWIEKGKWYHAVSIMMCTSQEGGIQGAVLQEIMLDESCAPYECFRLARFAIHKDDLGKLVELCKLSSELTGLNIERLIEESYLETV